MTDEIKKREILTTAVHEAAHAVAAWLRRGNLDGSEIHVEWNRRGENVKGGAALINFDDDDTETICVISFAGPLAQCKFLLDKDGSAFASSEDFGNLIKQLMIAFNDEIAGGYGVDVEPAEIEFISFGKRQFDVERFRGDFRIAMRAFVELRKQTGSETRLTASDELLQPNELRELRRYIRMAADLIDEQRNWRAIRELAQKLVTTRYDEIERYEISGKIAEVTIEESFKNDSLS